MIKKFNYFMAISFLSKYIIKYKKNLIIFYIGKLIDIIFTTIIPILFGIMINQIVYYQNTEVFLNVSFVVFTIMIFLSLLHFFVYSQHHYLMSMFTFEITKDVFNKFQNSSLEYLFYNRGSLSNIVLKYTKECTHFMIRNIINQINGLLSIILIMIFILRIEWRIGIIILISSLTGSILNKKYGYKVKNQKNKLTEEEDIYIGWIFEIFSNLNSIKILNARYYMFNKYKKFSKSIFKTKNNISVTNLTAENVIQFINLISLLSIYIVAAYLCYIDQLKIGSLVAILAYFSNFKDLLQSISNYYLDSQSRLSYINKLYEFVNIDFDESKIRNNKLTVTNGEITFDNVSFSYTKEKEILNNVNLKIHSCDHYGIIGENGSGKTTLINLLLGLYNAQVGVVKIDNQNLADCTLKSIRKNIGYLRNEPVIFDTTIKENLLIANKKATYDELKNACIYAGIWDYIDNLPNKLYTTLGNEGITLSQGQKKRISIARIFLKNCKIIIFDEFEASLDSKNIYDINSIIKNKFYDKTCIFITHNKETLKYCNKVLKVESGNLIKGNV